MSTIHNSSNVSHPASSSYIPPSVGNQTNRSSYCSTAVSVSDTATSRSSMSAADVSDQANNYFRTTCKTLKALRVESYEMTAHIMPIVSADEHPDYLQVIGEDADHLHTIDDNFSTINDEPGYSELDDVESSYNELESQQDNSRSHIEDGSTCQDNAGDEPAYQVVNDDSDYEQILYNEQNQAQVTNTSEQPLDITADLDKPQ